MHDALSPKEVQKFWEPIPRKRIRIREDVKEFFHSRNKKAYVKTLYPWRVPLIQFSGMKAGWFTFWTIGYDNNFYFFRARFEPGGLITRLDNLYTDLGTRYQHQEELRFCKRITIQPDTEQGAIEWLRTHDKDTPLNWKKPESGYDLKLKTHENRLVYYRELNGKEEIRELFGDEWTPLG